MNFPSSVYSSNLSVYSQTRVVLPRTRYVLENGCEEAFVVLWMLMFFVVDYGDGVFEIRRYVAGGVEGLVE